MDIKCIQHVFGNIFEVRVQIEKFHEFFKNFVLDQSWKILENHEFSMIFQELRISCLRSWHVTDQHD